MGAEPLFSELIDYFDEGLGRCHLHSAAGDRCPLPGEFVAWIKGPGAFGDYYSVRCPEHTPAPTGGRPIIAAYIDGVWEIDTDMVYRLQISTPDRFDAFLARPDIIVVNPCPARWWNHRTQRVAAITPPPPAYRRIWRRSRTLITTKTHMFFPGLKNSRSGDEDGEPKRSP